MGVPTHLVLEPFKGLGQAGNTVFDLVDSLAVVMYRYHVVNVL